LQNKSNHFDILGRGNKPIIVTKCYTLENGIFAGFNK